MSGDFVPGLAGVVAAPSAIWWINGLECILRYRGIRIESPSTALSKSATSSCSVSCQRRCFGAIRSGTEGISSFTSGCVGDSQESANRRLSHGCTSDGGCRLGTFHPHMDVTGRDGNRTAALRLIARCQRSWQVLTESKRIGTDCAGHELESRRKLSLHAEW